ncbi:MAG: ParB/RepB/Spo0J family partition protein [Beijerinckiaceae bacterium]|nr:ParB/RepB/Spo0J family partition protein [Beijerinckiaceae bacterium]
MADENRPRLGRGLAALLGDASVASPQPEAPSRGVRRVPIEYLRPNSRNPRRSFDDEQLDSLAASIREKGVIQPIIVRVVPNTTNSFEIVAGERRWRAAQRAGLYDVPIVVIEANDRETLEIAIIENVQRADLNPIDEALGYEQLLSHFQYTQADLARVIGKSRSHVTNTLRLLNLSESTRKLVMDGALSAGHARALLALPDADAAARRAVADGLSVRDLERLAQENSGSLETKSARAKVTEKDPNIRSLERELSDELGLAVTIDQIGDGGRLAVAYKSLDQFDMILRRLRN